jgi:plastocyanin
MGRDNAFRAFRSIVVGLGCAFALCVQAHATVHVIKFGGSLGNAYSPAALVLSVGDTVEWQGDFSFHPLTSTEIPMGAAGWTSSSGTVLDYIVTVPGTYNYKCEVHAPSMEGAFTATLSGITDPELRILPARFEVGQNYPNPFNPSTMVSMSLPLAGQVRFVVYNLLGEEVKVVVDGRMNAGVHQVEINGTGLASGAYIYQLSVDGRVVGTKRMVLLR